MVIRKSRVARSEENEPCREDCRRRDGVMLELRKPSLGAAEPKTEKQAHGPALSGAAEATNIASAPESRRSANARSTLSLIHLRLFHFAPPSKQAFYSSFTKNFLSLKWNVF